MDWAVQDAKARFSELLRATGKSPQIITYRGEPKYEIRELKPRQHKSAAKPKTLIEILKSCPKVPEFELPERRVEPMRKVDFGED
jgi:antitoxin (DNA-binding transcriptional repressor) of toxin-antitoxin stability system